MVITVLFLVLAVNVSLTTWAGVRFVETDSSSRLGWLYSITGLLGTMASIGVFIWFRTT